MPYITKVQRANGLDDAIHQAVEHLKRIAPLLDRPGPTNYVVTRIVAGALKPDTGWSYHSISRALAVLHDAETEMRRRLMDAREDIVIEENGDVLEYMQ
jgi:hypothetical protein